MGAGMQTYVLVCMQCTGVGSGGGEQASPVLLCLIPEFLVSWEQIPVSSVPPPSPFSRCLLFSPVDLKFAI